ncbi:SDR family NAD(P)-dependent oxidoreductase [Jiulongibacter sediminis]|uniref:Short-chain dehydrogenase n=1 Tax=Jiulongibacter sediminis TaxID=1605367 RepID=A0A0P7BYU1_9BACT|nr:SDR family NAD(P)-dependent oxidoreductase [Jiulongibacter sediminis]KPM46741.1 short-chain dehydrogenase [Jiulongibacter sediminis]TBX21648.1 short-chain dehydrogenase [Jiulongibacter sediminis]
MIVNQKTILLTGAGSGMGREMALLLLKKGANVAGVDIHPDALAETQRLGGVDDSRFKGFVLDITNKEKVDALPAEVIGHFGQVDGLINNAGIIQKFIMVNELELSDIERVMNVNFYGPVYFIKAFLPHLLKRPEGHLVNISSMGGFLPVPGQTIYGASKAAIKLLTEGLYSELAKTNVKVTVVFPGAIQTNISENSGLKAPSAEQAENSKFKALPAQKAAEIIIKGMEENQFRVTVGPDAGFLDKLYRLAPKYAANFIRKKMGSLLNQ